MVFVSELGVVRLQQILEASSSAVLHAFIVHSNRFGLQSYVHSDSGSNFNPFVTSLSPIAESDTEGKLPDLWAELLEGHKVRELREKSGAIFRVYAQGRHVCLSSAEKIIRLLKTNLIKSGLFKRSQHEPILSQEEFLHAISCVEKFLNSRPILCQGNLVYSIQDFASLTLQANPLLGVNLT